MAVARRLPAWFLGRWFGLWAPLFRYGGRSRAGAAALRRALYVLLEERRPPMPEATLSLADIATRVRASESDVERWAASGLLAEPVHAGPPPAWGRSGLERARLSPTCCASV